MRASSVSLALLVAALGLSVLVAGCGSPLQDLDNRDNAASNPLPTDAELKALLDNVIDFNEARYMNSVDHGAWQIMHGVLAYGYDCLIYHDGKLVGALQWGFDGGPMDGFLFRHAAHGLDSVLQPGTKRGQGHDDQWLAIMAQANAPIDARLLVDGQTYTIKDLVTEAQWGLYQGAEASWTLTGLNKYLVHSLEDFDKTWKARDGGDWSVARVVAMEAGYELNDSACGGTHRLMSLNGALKKYLSLGGELKGGWLAAQEKINGAVARFEEYQNTDGSFSTSYLFRPGNTTDIARRINTTGHTVEFLVQATPQEQLRDPWLVRGVVELCKMLQLTENLSVECGSLYHALHGLVIYRERLFGPRPQSTKPAQGTASTPSGIAPATPPEPPTGAPPSEAPMPPAPAPMPPGTAPAPPVDAPMPAPPSEAPAPPSNAPSPPSNAPSPPSNAPSPPA